MTALTNTDPNTTYKDLYQTGSGTGTGLTASLQSLTDGAGATAPIQFSTAAVNITALQYNGSAISIAGALTFSGAYAFTATLTNTTAVTFPTSGTLSTLAGAESLSNKTIVAPIFSGSATGTYTLAGTPTLTSPTINSPTMTTPALGVVASGNISACTSTSMTMVTPILGTVTSGNISACTSTSMAMVTPILGTPTSGNLVNCTGFTAANVASNTRLITAVAVQVFTATGTYTPTAGTQYALVELWGAGGGGGASASASAFGAAGGGGAYSSAIVHNPTAITITIGAAGTGQVANNSTAGTDGGNTLYNTNVIIAAGGSHGSNVTLGAGGTVANCTGTTKIAGGAGSYSAAVTSMAWPGGGAPMMPMVLNFAGAAASPVNQGQGGCSGYNSGNGGNGGTGYARVTEFIAT